jgi:hypothetical protein
MKRLIVVILLASVAVCQVPKKKQGAKKAPPRASGIAIASTEIGACNPSEDIGGGGSGIFFGSGWVTSYYKCSKDGKWVIDEEAMEVAAKQEQSRRDLYWALRTRVLTIEEMKQVEGLGIYLVVATNGSYNPVEKEAELNAALLQQFKLRLAEEEHRAKMKADKQ